MEYIYKKLGADVDLEEHHLCSLTKKNNFEFYQHYYREEKLEKESQCSQRYFNIKPEGKVRN